MNLHTQYYGFCSRNKKKESFCCTKYKVSLLKMKHNNHISLFYIRLEKKNIMFGKISINHAEIVIDNLTV